MRNVATAAGEHRSSERTPVRRLRALTSLRFAAAAAIVVHHLGGVFGVPKNVTSEYPLATGVSFFFVLSGFILTHVYSAKELNAREFLLARIGRIWPAHIAALLLTIILRPDVIYQFTLARLALYITLTHAWIPLEYFYYAFVPAAWSISTEFAFYLSFLLLIPNWRRTWHWKLALTFLMLGTMLAIGNVASHHGTERQAERFVTAFAYVHPFTRLFEFALGMTFALAWNRYEAVVRIGRIAGTLVEVVVVAGTLLLVSMLHQNIETLTNISWIGPAGAAWAGLSGGCLGFAVLIFVFAMERGLLSRVLSLSPAVLLGEISYSIYLIHAVIIRKVVQKAELFAGTPNGICLAITAALIALTAYLIWALIERPCRAYFVSVARSLPFEGWPSRGSDATSSLLVPSWTSIGATGAVLGILVTIVSFLKSL